MSAKFDHLELDLVVPPLDLIGGRLDPASGGSFDYREKKNRPNLWLRGPIRPQPARFGHPTARFGQCATRQGHPRHGNSATIFFKKETSNRTQLKVYTYIKYEGAVGVKTRDDGTGRL